MKEFLIDRSYMSQSCGKVVFSSYFIIFISFILLSTRLIFLLIHLTLYSNSFLNLFKNVKCDRPEQASLQALQITNKTQFDLRQGMSKLEACDIIEKFLNEDNLNPDFRCIVGHNIQFDRKFLFAMFDECKKSFPANLWLDTIDMSRQIFKANNLQTKGKLKLADACNSLGVKLINGAHQAKVDSRNTYMLWKKIKYTNFNFLPHIKTVKHKQENIDYTDSEINDLLDEINDN